MIQPSLPIRRQVALTPLCPLHIGAGEHFDPSSYLLDQELLHVFTPGAAILSEAARTDLLAACETARLQDIQLTLHKYRTQFRRASWQCIPVSPAMQKEYDQRIGQVAQHEEDRDILNQLLIVRHIQSASDGLPYIPGSSLKGALRTATLDNLGLSASTLPPPERNGRWDSAKLEADQLGDFANSAFRWLSISDLRPTDSSQVARQVLYTINHYKTGEPGDTQRPKGVSVRTDCIGHGPFRPFVGELSLREPLPGNTPQRQLTLPTLIHDCNRYHLRQWQADMALYRAANCPAKVQQAWLDSVDALFADYVRDACASGRTMLVRLGRGAGAESKTLRGENIAKIKIMQKKGEEAKELSHTKTLWFVGDSSKQKHNLWPLGWALLELDPEPDNPALRAWSESHPRWRKQMAHAHTQLAKCRQEQGQEQARVRECAERERQAAAQAQADALLSPRQRQVRDALAQLSAPPVHKNTGVPEFAELMALLHQAAQDQAWRQDERQQLADGLSLKAIERKFTSLNKDRKAEVRQRLEQLRQAPST